MPAHRYIYDEKFVRVKTLGSVIRNCCHLYHPPRGEAVYALTSSCGALDMIVVAILEMPPIPFPSKS